MSFGTTIKALRHGANMTQERLAELLSISPQAVSRWETDAAMPDISLLPPLATLFGVTTDHLLGMDSYQRDLRRAEFDEAFHDYWKHDDKERNYQIALRAVEEYPGDMAYVEWLASAEYYVAIPKVDDEEYHRLLESSIRHYRIVLDGDVDAKLRDKALCGITLALSMNGQKDKAMEYAVQIEDETSQEDMIGWCLEGEEKSKHHQRMLEKALNRFISYLSLIPGMERCLAMEKILQILIPDGNYQYYHNHLQYNAIAKATLLLNEPRYDDAIAALRQARYHAEEMVTYGNAGRYRFTAPLFCHVEGEKPVSDAVEDDVDDFIRCLQNYRCFDPLRDREDFKALMQRKPI